jgi:2-polyprenyl-6-methoxyphenol hydroxylase-like FAD-dependent oxidoreductase
VALVGDAAWCVTPLGGVGATLAVVGAYILAGEMASNPDLGSAYVDYERKLRGFVNKAQGIPKIVPRLANPHSRIGLAVLHGAVRVASAPGVGRILGKLLGGKSKDLELPEYRGAMLSHPEDLTLFTHDVA